MIAFTIVGILVLILIYFVIRSQTLQREASVSKHAAKTTSKRLKDAYSGLILVCTDLQKVYLERVESAYQKRLISAEDHTVMRFIMSHFSQIVIDCFEKRHSVEEALKNAVKSSEISEQDVRDVIKKQPSHLRMAWVKNTPEGFMEACAQLSVQPLKAAQPAAEDTAAKA
ncbi:hypothetical protein [Salinimonas chungwhensis]|jgi:hypothetical protein|uniref:hypothetical protein n=1 Tax=Salinimonas chungwhensis TaxID=265425 RepID=UPI00035D1018|nr:hypothetical protein [Salinimonas chungwhensis]